MKKKMSSFMSSKFFLIIAAVICSIFIVTSFFTDALVNPIRNVVSKVVIPAQKGINYLGLWIHDNYETFQSMDKLLAENEQLKTEISKLTEENENLKQDTYELERLRDLYELDAKYPQYEKCAARIIGSTADNWYTTFTVDKGSDDGIKVDMNVIADGGLVGIITYVGKNYSIVKCIIEDNSYVSGMKIDSGDLCTCEGDIELRDKGLIYLTKFKSIVNVRDGDKIVTSNISDKYLPGLLIGYAKDVTLDSNTLSQSGYLVPAVDFEHLQEVLIIKQLKFSGN